MMEPNTITALTNMGRPICHSKLMVDCAKLHGGQCITCLFLMPSLWVPTGFTVCLSVTCLFLNTTFWISLCFTTSVSVALLFQYAIRIYLSTISHQLGLILVSIFL